MCIKPGVHTNDFAPIHRLRALKLGHASLATVFRPGRLTLQPILRENLESPVLRYQPITTAVVTDACLNTRWHHGAYTSAVLRESLGLDRVVTVYAELSRPDWLATVQSGRKQVQSRVCTPSLKPGVHTNDFAPIHRRRALKLGHASLATVFRPARLTFQQIPQENLESPLLKEYSSLQDNPYNVRFIHTVLIVHNYFAPRGVDSVLISESVTALHVH